MVAERVVDVAQLDRQARVGRVQEGDQRREAVRRQPDRQADAQHADRLAADLADRGDQRARLLQHVAAAAGQQRAGLGDDDPAGASLEQGHAGAGLERVDAAAEGGAGDVQVGGGREERAGLDHRDEGPEFFEVHGRRVSVHPRAWPRHGRRRALAAQ